MDKHKLFRRAIAVLVLSLSAGGAAYAQDFILPSPTAVVRDFNLPSFFICLVGGVLLAIGFQTLLTLISIATGVSAIGNLKKKGNQSHNSSDAHKNDEDQTPAVVKISNAMGVWTMVTVSVSLFFASWLAVRLSLLDANFIGVSLGLIIWATFFTLMVYLEVKMVTSLLGGLINTALSTLRTGFSTVSAVGNSIMGKSHETEMKEVAAYTVEHARREIGDMLDTRKVDKKINKWVSKLEPDYKRMHRELASLIEDIEVKEEKTLGPEGVTKDIFLNVTSGMHSMSKRDKKKMGELFDQIKSAAQSKGSTSDKVLTAVDKLTPGSEEDTRQFRAQVEKYLRQANREELNPDKLKKDLEEIISHPSRSPQIIMNRLKQFDKNSLMAVLEQRPGINHQDAERYAGYAEQAINTIRTRFSDAKGKAQNMSSSMSGDGKKENTNLENAELGVIHTDRGERVTAYAPAQENFRKPVDRKESSAVEGRLRSFFEDMPGKEWDYDSIKRDFIQMFHDPAAAPTILSQRLSQYDRDSFIVLMDKTGLMSKEQAEKIADKVIEAKEDAIRKSNELEDQARQKVQQAKDFALEQAEASRKSAVAASWWLVGTAIVSGFAAALGGMMAF